MKPRFIILTVLLIVLSFVLTGCNLFGWTAGSDSESLIEEGNRLMRDGKFTEAAAKFADAMTKDPDDSEARYYHAKATLRASGFNALSLGTEMTETTFADGASLPFSGNNWTQEKTIRLYKAITIVYNDLNPIYYGSTTGDITRSEVDIDYALAAGIRGILIFQDSNLDGEIAAEDFDISIKYGGGQFEIGNLFTLITGQTTPKPRPDFSTAVTVIDSAFACSQITEFNAMIDNIEQVLEEASDVIAAITAELGVDPDEVQAVLDVVIAVAHKYKINDGIDNDGNNGADEEMIDGLDNDGDGLIDEDSVFDCSNF